MLEKGVSDQRHAGGVSPFLPEFTLPFAQEGWTPLLAAAHMGAKLQGVVNKRVPLHSGLLVFAAPPLQCVCCRPLCCPPDGWVAGGASDVTVG